MCVVKAAAQSRKGLRSSGRRALETEEHAETIEKAFWTERIKHSLRSG